MCIHEAAEQRKLRHESKGKAKDRFIEVSNNMPAPSRAPKRAPKANKRSPPQSTTSSSTDGGRGGNLFAALDPSSQAVGSINEQGINYNPSPSPTPPPDIVEEQKGPPPQRQKPKNKKNKKKKNKKQPADEEEDLDAILADFGLSEKQKKRCAEKGCKRKAHNLGINGRDCKYCHMRFCTEHGNPLFHSGKCDELYRKDQRANQKKRLTGTTKKTGRTAKIQHAQATFKFKKAMESASERENRAAGPSQGKRKKKGKRRRPKG